MARARPGAAVRAAARPDMATHSAARDARPTGAGLKLRLYIAGSAPNSTLAQANLAALLKAYGIRDHELEVVDCIRDPKRALRDGVLVTPTLLRVSPAPQQTIVGTLSDTRRVAAALDLPTAPQGERASA